MERQYYYNNEVQFDWGKYGSNIGYYLTKELITSYEREKGLYLKVDIVLDDNLVIGLKLTLIDSDNKFDKNTICSIICNRLMQIVGREIEIIDGVINISDKTMLVMFIEKSGIKKNIFYHEKFGRLKNK